MLKYFVLSLYLLTLVWQGCSEVEEFDEDDYGEIELNVTDGDIVPLPRFGQINVYDKIYTFSVLPVNWHTARELCAAQNQVLASVNNAQDTVNLIDALRQQGVLYSGLSFWIGGSELGHIGQWSWVDTGRPGFYTNWQYGSPINYCNRNCMELLSDGRWNNDDCDSRKPVICQNLPLCSSYQTSRNG